MPSIEKERCSQCNQVAHLLSSDDPESGEKTAGSKPRYVHFSGTDGACCSNVCLLLSRRLGFVIPA